jgi:hypothetical protein
MPTLVADANLPMSTTEGFFNELEGEILAAIIAGGTAYYKLTQEKGGGNFIAVEAVTEIPDEAVLHEEYRDRFELFGEEYEHDYLFVHFSV